MKLLLIIFVLTSNCLAMDNHQMLESYIDTSSVSNLPHEKLDGIFNSLDIKDKRTLIRTHQDQVFGLCMNKIFQDANQKFEAHERVMAREYRTVQWLKGLFFVSSCSLLGTSIYMHLKKRSAINK